MDENHLKITNLNGFNGTIRNGLKVHPDNTHIIYSVGSSLVIEDASTGGQELLQGHTDFITCIAVANGNGELLASGQKTSMGSKADIIIWDYSSRRKKYKLVLHRGSIQALAFSPTNMYLASLGGSDDGSVAIWDMEWGEAICGAPAQAVSAGNTVCLVFSKTSDNVFITAGESTIRTWDLDVDNRKVRPIDVNTGQLRRIVLCIEVEDDDSMFFCGTTTGDILAFNMHSRIFLAQAPEKNKFELGVTALARVEDGSFLVGTGCGRLHLFRFNIGHNSSKIVRSWPEPNNKSICNAAITSIAVDSSGKQFYMGTANSLMYRFSISSFDTGKLLKNCHTARVNDLDFPMASSQLIVTCQSEQVRVWLTKDLTELARFTITHATCNSAKVSDDGRFIVSGWDDGVIRVLNGQTLASVAKMEDAHSKGVTAVACKRDCSGIVTGGGEGQVRVWQYTHGMGSASFKLLAVMKEHKSRVTEIQIRGDDNECVSACEDGTCIIWDLVKHNRRQSFFASTVFKCVSYSWPDEDMIITSGTDRKITFWDVSDATIIRELYGSISGTVNALDVSTNGKFFVSGGEDKLLKVWKSDEGKVVKLGTGLTSGITCAKISPDMRSVVTAAEDGAICTWTLPKLD